MVSKVDDEPFSFGGTGGFDQVEAGGITVIDLESKNGAAPSTLASSGWWRLNPPMGVRAHDLETCVLPSGNLSIIFL
jgi:hypothetical protein